jgi:hypothetical protein
MSGIFNGVRIVHKEVLSMNDIIDSIDKHLPSIVPNSFILFENGSCEKVLTGLMGDKSGRVWFIEMCRESGKIIKKIQQNQERRV